MLGLKQYKEKGGRIDKMTEENMGEDELLENRKERRERGKL